MGEVPNGHATARALNERLRALDTTIRRWAAYCCLTHADRRLVHVDDVANLMRWECARELRRARDDADGADRADGAPSEAYLRRIAARAGDRYFHSSARTGFSGATGAARRSSRARTTAAALTTILGREPTSREVIDAVNTQARSTRVDPVKQGALIGDVGDLLAEPLPLDERLAARDALDDRVHARISAELAVVRTIEVCRAMDPALGEVAGQWLSGALATPPSIPTVAEIAAAGSHRTDEVRELLDECRIVAELVCQELGLSPG
jgi:hypothetical protein